MHLNVSGGVLRNDFDAPNPVEHTDTHSSNVDTQRQHGTDKQKEKEFGIPFADDCGGGVTTGREASGEKKTVSDPLPFFNVAAFAKIYVDWLVSTA